MESAGSQLDTRVRVVTPENIAFEYRIAGPFARIGAYLIDCLICVFIALAALIAMGIVFSMLGLGGLALGLIQVFWFALSWFYGGVFETFWNGQTPGKRLVGIRVLTVDGQPIDGLQAVLRNILRTADWLPVFILPAGLFAAALTRRMQRLGDLASGTMVVAEEPRWFRELVQINDPEALALSERIPPDFQVGRSLARALAVYVQRRTHFSWPRRLEIARHLAAPLCEQWKLPPGTNPDALLCALYRRTFGIELADWPAVAGSPFVVSPAGAAVRAPQRNGSPAVATVALTAGGGSPFSSTASPGGRR